MARKMQGRAMSAERAAVWAVCLAARSMRHLLARIERARMVAARSPPPSSCVSGRSPARSFVRKQARLMSMTAQRRTNSSTTLPVEDVPEALLSTLILAGDADAAVLSRPLYPLRL